ncbi:hypothetical protein BCR34DRAFT_560336 [Clohesyomyces aquaticus]|uniref:DUF7730 domain-containing protein n=1 Tax=Clohesyomyces aquaticus TaxID=1231657 RepID=A0A1Y1ZVX8_9PLEO|nr:hypothetical protein BCR34DRAFT_560336 [Clohesyomyces aquaticus]
MLCCIRPSRRQHRPTSIAMTYISQGESPFFTKLPLELRQMVYMYALGGISIHLLWRDGWTHMRGKRCCQEMCYHRRVFTSDQKALDLAPSLLRTCRKIYSEASEYLYSSNTFCIWYNVESEWSMIEGIARSAFYDDFGFCALPRILGPRPFGQIRSLRYFWDMQASDNPDFPLKKGAPWSENWYMVWKVLSTMKELRELFFLVTLNLHTPKLRRLWRERAVEMFEPVKDVTAPTSFLVVLTDSKLENSPEDIRPASLDIGDSSCVFQVWPYYEVEKKRGGNSGQSEGPSF